MPVAVPQLAGSPGSALLTFVGRCDPNTPAAPPEYIARPSKTAERLRDQVETTETTRVLLMGQTGVGKTTELAHLERLVHTRFLPLRPPLDAHLDLGTATWHDVFVFTAAWAVEGWPGSVDRHLRHQLREALRPPTTVEKPPAFWSGPQRETTGGPPEPTPTQRFRNDQAAVQDVIRLGPAQFWDLGSAILSNLAKATGRPVLLLLDGFEKLAVSQAERLFGEGGRTLSDLPCRAVVTAPLGLSFTRDFGDIEEKFLFTERIRAVSCRSGEPGRAFFEEMATARGAYDIMAPEVVEDAISWGGGLPRQFLKLLGEAASRAHADGLGRVEPECAARAQIRVADRWQYQLEPSHRVALKLPDREREGVARSELLRLGALIEYDLPDGTLRLGINPLVGPLLTRREPDEP